MSNRSQAMAGLAAGAPVRPVIPTDFDQAVRMAKTIVQAGLFQAETEEKALAQATMAVLQGLELGIAPMQAAQHIAMIGGRCVIWGDLVPALIWRAGHKIKEWLEGDGDARVAWCEITRGDNQEVIKRKFSVDDAKRAGLWDVRAKIKLKDKTNSWQEEDNDNPWFRHQERMLQMRARGFCARDGAPDALHGLYIREEIVDKEEAPKEKGRSREPLDKGAKASAGDLCPRRLRLKNPKHPVGRQSRLNRQMVFPSRRRSKLPKTLAISSRTLMSALRLARQKINSMRSGRKTSKRSAPSGCSYASRRSACTSGIDPASLGRCVLWLKLRKDSPGPQHESLSNKRAHRRAQLAHS